MEKSPVDISVKGAPPYFDILFSRLAENEPATTIAFGRHVHWGYWEEPAAADGSPQDYARAAECLCRRVCDAAQIQDGMAILDVGCGFGGTICSLNERFANLDLVGVNIDQRQLEQARKKFQPQHGNRARFLEADAGRLPFPADSFDVILAVEAIFHFESRDRFFAEAGRVLKPAGRLALSDFVPPEEAVPTLRAFNTSTNEAARRAYGKIDILCSLKSYRDLAGTTGLSLESEDNISPHTLPTYPFLRSHMKTWKIRDQARAFDKATAQLEMASHTGLLNYTILSFQKNSKNAA